MKTIVITGSNGLIGKLLCNKINKSYHIEKIDNNLPLNSPEYGDILLPKTLKKKLYNCDGIIHLAAISRVIYGEKKPSICWRTNVTGTNNIMNLAYKSFKKPWVLYASSREVYGQQKKFPVKESAFLKPLNIYAKSKIEAENIIKKYKLKGLKTQILRFSNVYGSINDYHDRVIPAFCKAAFQGKPIYIEGKNNTFDFTHVIDVIEAILKVIQRLEQNIKLPIMHITSNKPTTLETLANLIYKFSTYPPNFIIKPSRKFDVSKFYGDNSLVNKLLNWIPKIDLELGVSMLIKDFCKKNTYKN